MSTIIATAKDKPGRSPVGWLASGRLPDRYPLGPVGAFLLLVACLVALRAELPDGSLNELHWVLAVAAIPLLPWLLPHVKGFRAGPVEVELRDLDPEQIGPGVEEMDHATEALTELSIPDTPNGASDILDRVREIEAERAELVAIDLSAKWRLSTLYFFAFLLESRTSVRRLVFEERAFGKRTFLGMCSPRDLRQSIERERPLYRDVRKRTPLVDLDSSGQAFLRALVDEICDADDRDGHSPLLGRAGLKQLVGSAFEPEWLERGEIEGLPGLRRVLGSERQYVAVVERDVSYQVLDRMRVALAVARRAAGA
jgi:hypothetical protein